MRGACGCASSSPIATSASDETSGALKGSDEACGYTLKSLSPMARETASVCSTRPCETHPPAAVMRSLSSMRSGL